MTLPFERLNAIVRTEQFLLDLLDPTLTPRVSKEIRQAALACLRHYPNTEEMQRASEAMPELFGTFEQTFSPKKEN